MAELWQLPGPLHHLQMVAEDLQAGRSVVLVRPKSRPPLDYEHHLRRQLGPTRAWERVELGPTDGLDDKRHVDALFSRFSLPDHSPAARRTVDRLITHEDWHYRVIWVDATTTPPDLLSSWWRFVTEYASTSQAVGTSERTPILTVIDGAAAGALPAENVLLTIRWWWSVIDKVDTAVHVGTLTRERNVDPTFASACVEIAGFDLDLAEDFLHGWDGRLDGAVELLRARAENTPNEFRSSELPYELPGAAERPATAHLTAWNAGVLERWDGRPTWHPTTIDGDGIRSHLHHLIWKAQLAAVLPELETRRLDVARWCEHRKEHVTSDHYEGCDILALEYANLLDFMKLLPGSRRDPQRMQLLRWAKNARDDLAHAKIIEPDGLKSGRQLLSKVPTGVG